MKENSRTDEITRVMNRLNLIIKVQDKQVKETYYLFMKSSKLWADINFVSARIFSNNTPGIKIRKKNAQSFSLNSQNEKLLNKHLYRSEESLTREICIDLAGEELDKVFGIRDFDGELLPHTIDYIEPSKTVSAITYYRHHFFVLTRISDLKRLIGLKTIELIPLSLMKSLADKKNTLHEGYNPSMLLEKFIRHKFWELDPYPSPELIQENEKNRIGVLFSDIKGFGTLVKNFPSIKESESTQLMIKKYQHHSALEIKANGGYVIQTAGDAFMAIFKLPENSTDDSSDVIRIIRAALGILKISKIEIDEASMHLVTRVGLNIAHIEEGFLGALDLREYTVFGKDVNIASRLEKKVDEIAESIEGFAGGLLFNLSNCKDNIKDTELRSLQKVEQELKIKAGGFKLKSFSNRLKKFSNEVKMNYVTDSLMEKIIRELNPYLKELSRDDEYSYHISAEIREVQVKEGNTKCIFLYKQKKD
ncbi:MAG: adenylate/guanylate cyclase domain-containing protein [Leptospiraceae bacterium]|nr:adenylate/guanylate cyclase domain-containing protein [Leptospiraceae bacterium]MCP5499004.1 adenylate/guanylate cyclase domain-containing protein [Leptospiraceae bacterium]